jgi:hypothetical protein
LHRYTEAAAAAVAVNGTDATAGVVGALAPLRAAGFTREALDMILLPMIGNADEALGRGVIESKRSTLNPLLLLLPLWASV